MKEVKGEFSIIMSLDKTESGRLRSSGIYVEARTPEKTFGVSISSILVGIDVEEQFLKLWGKIGEELFSLVHVESEGADCGDD